MRRAWYLFSESKINFTLWNRVLLSERSILHLENAMFSKIRPYFLRTFCMGDRFMQKILKISAFSDTIFFRKFMSISDFPTRLEQSVKLFLQTPLSTCFLGKNCLFSESKINFTHWNRVLLSERSILHLENAMFSKIRPYFLRTFCMGDRFMQKILKISAFSDTIFFRKFMSISDFRTRLEQSV